MKSILFPASSITFGLMITVLLLKMVFRVLPTSDSLQAQSVNAENPVLRYRENRDVLISRGYNFAIAAKKHVNNYGFVNDQDYVPEQNTPLLAIIGDSYVEATQVENRATMHGLLAATIAERGRVYSFGASGAPLSTYLAYAEYAKNTLSPDGMAFVVVGNDFDESISTYKYAPGLSYFVPSDGSFDLKRVDYMPTHLQVWARRSALCRYLMLNLRLDFATLADRFVRRATADAGSEFVGNTRAAASLQRITDSKAAVDEFLRRLPANSGLANDEIIMVVDGLRPNLYDANSLRHARQSYFSVLRDYFMFRARALGFVVVDLQPIFVAAYQAGGERFEFPSDAHWNAVGHRVAASAINRTHVFQSLFE